MTEPLYHQSQNGERIAYHRIEGAGPTVVWLGGIHSDMGGTKAVALHDWAQASGRGYLRFDYFGHGGSSGAFADGTIGRWRADALEMIDQLTDGRLVLVGSSMGGWLACLAALARPERIKGMVLIAPAADFTDKLMELGFSNEARVALRRDGRWTRPSEYEDGGYVITAELIEEGRAWSILPGPVRIACPVHILQGGRDLDVPWRHALALAEAIEGPDVIFSFVKDGDHRLSRPQDLHRMIQAVEDVS